MSFGNKSIIKDTFVDVYIANNTLHVLAQHQNISNKVEINFCPMCGRKFIK
jgi:hypothetical protein